MQDEPVKARETIVAKYRKIASTDTLIGVALMLPDDNDIKDVILAELEERLKRYQAAHPE